MDSFCEMFSFFAIAATLLFPQRCLLWLVFIFSWWRKCCWTVPWRSTKIKTYLPHCSWCDAFVVNMFYSFMPEVDVVVHSNEVKLSLQAITLNELSRKRPKNSTYPYSAHSVLFHRLDDLSRMLAKTLLIRTEWYFGWCSVKHGNYLKNISAKKSNLVQFDFPF